MAASELGFRGNDPVGGRLTIVDFIEITVRDLIYLRKLGAATCRRGRCDRGLDAVGHDSGYAAVKVAPECGHRGNDASPRSVANRILGQLCAELHSRITARNIQTCPVGGDEIARFHSSRTGSQDVICVGRVIRIWIVRAGKRRCAVVAKFELHGRRRAGLSQFEMEFLGYLDDADVEGLSHGCAAIHREIDRSAIARGRLSVKARMYERHGVDAQVVEQIGTGQLSRGTDHEYEGKVRKIRTIKGGCHGRRNGKFEGVVDAWTVAPKITVSNKNFAQPR